jgi:hypothetical protein
MSAGLAPVLVFCLCPTPEARPIAERLAIDTPPGFLGCPARRFVQPIPLDAGLAEIRLQLVIA